MVMATVVAGWLLRRQQSSLDLTAAQKWGIAIGGFIGVTFAAKVPFVLSMGLSDASASASTGSAGVLGAWMSDGKTVLWGSVVASSGLSQPRQFGSATDACDPDHVRGGSQRNVMFL